MTKKINKKFLLYLLILISMTLVSAYVIEYKFDHKPCKLCLYQRIPYFLSILLIAKIFFTSGYERITFLILAFVFIVSSILAFYHFGIEQGFFRESLACTAGNLSETLSKAELLEQLKQETISCKDVSLKILGFSLAAINTILSIFLSAIFLKLFSNYENDK
ncbi:disulfide bond formation protein B [Pelagibacteraceae bacterium]|nr:disulfide bond formation protein B [Pelagibacteraceae bacterium]